MAAPAVSVSVTFVFGAKLALHVPGQLIPVGLLVTVPVPLPDVVTVNASPGVNAADTLSVAVIVTLQAAIPEQAPLQPPK